MGSGGRGYTVTDASDGEEALRSARRSSPALILLDYGLPLLDGAGVADGLRTAGLSSIPIVLLTADERMAEKATRVGARASMPKPLDIDELLRIVADLMPAP